MRLPRQFRTRQHDSSILVHVREHARYYRLLGCQGRSSNQPPITHKTINSFIYSRQASALPRKYPRAHRAVGTRTTELSSSVVNPHPLENFATTSSTKPHAPGQDDGNKPRLPSTDMRKRPPTRVAQSNTHHTINSHLQAVVLEAIRQLSRRRVGSLLLSAMGHGGLLSKVVRDAKATSHILGILATLGRAP